MVTKRLKLTYPHQHIGGKPLMQVYRVEQTTNTTDYHPGDMLDKETVDRLCRKSNWTIVIDSPRQ